MTFKEKLEKEKRWCEKIFIIALYHNSKLYHNNKWKIIDTANYFDVSIGQISEALKLCEAIKKYPALENLSRNQALKKLRDIERGNDVNW